MVGGKFFSTKKVRYAIANTPYKTITINRQIARAIYVRVIDG